MARRRSGFGLRDIERFRSIVLDRYDGYFPPRSVPRRARGGIKAQSKRGSFGTSWWAKRWIGVLERMNVGARLGRGRRYARGGQVLAIDIEPGTVRAQVQGSRPSPYQVEIQVRELGAAGWKKLAQHLSRQAIFSAKLLAGEMPEDIETVFDEAGLSLFPSTLRDLTTSCSCPDWSNPCKHIAAVYYLLGEEFDRDPFLIFKLRGMAREELVALLAPAVERRAKGRGPSPVAEEPGATPLSVGADVSAFWTCGALPEDLWGEVAIPPVSAALPRRLGRFPFWRGEEDFLEALERIYAAASPAGLDAFVAGEAAGEGAG